MNTMILPPCNYYFVYFKIRSNETAKPAISVANRLLGFHFTCHPITVLFCTTGDSTGAPPTKPKINNFTYTRINTDNLYSTIVRIFSLYNSNIFFYKYLHFIILKFKQ